MTDFSPRSEQLLNLTLAVPLCFVTLLCGCGKPAASPNVATTKSPSIAPPLPPGFNASTNASTARSAVVATQAPPQVPTISASFAWDSPNSNFNFYLGTAPSNYTQKLSVSTNLITLTGLKVGQEYHCAVTAVNGPEESTPTPDLGFILPVNTIFPSSNGAMRAYMTGPGNWQRSSSLSGPWTNISATASNAINRITNQLAGARQFFRVH